MKLAVGLSLLAAAGLGAWYWWLRPPKPWVSVVTLAAMTATDKVAHEPFGIAANDDGEIFFSDGVTGRIYRLPAAGYASESSSAQASVIAEGLETPSALAFDAQGDLIVANTGAHTIVRIDSKTNRLSVIAGADGVSGFADGPGPQARFNGPVGIATGRDGTIFVADTYNDRIREISPDGQVRTIAGGAEPGFTDGSGAEARFDTPCGIAVAQDGSLLVADLGNNQIRRAYPDGRVTTIVGTAVSNRSDGAPVDDNFEGPIAIAVKDQNSFYVSEAFSSTIRLYQLGEQARVTLVTGGNPRPFPYGLADDELSKAQLNQPAGLALLPDGELAFADSGNGLVRALVPAESAIGRRVDPQSVIIQAPEMRNVVTPRWPFDPPEARRDIAGTFGEIRGERLPERMAWFHAGLDVPGAYGEVVRAVFTERVTWPLAVVDVGGPRENIRLPLFQYIHLRIGRDQNDQPLGNLPDGAVMIYRNQEGRPTRVRVRRGTLIKAGDPIGTLNRLNHVHLVTGPFAFEFNALTALKLPGLTDTIPPVIEAVTITTERDIPLLVQQPATGKREKTPPPPVELSGKLRIAVRAYDQVDGNPRYRRLGVYRLGYQILNSDNSPAADFGEPRYNIVFDRISYDPQAVSLAYTEGSQSGYQGLTVFDYLVTNIVRHGEAREDFWDTTKLAPGSYILRVLAEDFFGNQARQELPVTISK
ncbi:MAG TPA: hypothetical protein VJ302_37325 [Blastocatellia bacterium]|nr:hypothetical protein [Blastocatellia bacterium]